MQLRPQLFNVAVYSVLPSLLVLLVCRRSSDVFRYTFERNKGSITLNRHLTDQITMNRHLTDKQCDQYFPGLYSEIDRAAEYWRSNGNITTEAMAKTKEKAHARVLIKNGRMYVLDYGQGKGFAPQATRNQAVLFDEAVVTSPEPIPDIEFAIFTADAGDDWGCTSLGSGSRTTSDFNLVDASYGFVSWPEPGVGSFLEVQDKTAAYESKTSWSDKIPKLFWRGALMVDIRKQLVEIAASHRWGDVAGLDWSKLDGELRTPEEHCQYKYLAQVEGYAYSGRLKYLLQCRSVVVSHAMHYIQHFHHLFDSDSDSPDQNIVVVPGSDLDALPETMQHLLQDDERAEKIADTAFKFWHYWLSTASINCYWRRMFLRWAEVQPGIPDLPHDATPYVSFM